MTPTRPLARAVLLGALLAAACGDSGADPGVDALALDTAAGPGARLLGRWQVAEPVLPPTTIELTREGSTTRARVALSGITYDGRATGDDTSVVIHDGDRATIRGALLPGGQQLRIHFLRADGQPEFTQVLVRQR